MIRVQREVREKSDRLLVLESQYAALERVRTLHYSIECTRDCRTVFNPHNLYCIIFPES